MSSFAGDRARRSFPIITILLVVVNVLVFAGWQLQAGVDQSIAGTAPLPHEFTSNPISIWIWSSLFESMFMHTGWLHLLCNVCFLSYYGWAIENECGSTRFLFLYFLCGLIAALAFFLINPHGDVPLVGASGAVSGVIGAYCLDFGAQVNTSWDEDDNPVEATEAGAVSSLWFGAQILALKLKVPEQIHSVGSIRGIISIGMALAAPIGGFLAGAILIVFLKKWRRE